MRSGEFSIIQFKIRKSVSTTNSAMLFAESPLRVEALFVFLRRVIMATLESEKELF